MKLLAIGDNAADCYIEKGVYFPGGNVVNVAVNAKQSGAEKVNYIGVFGNDEKAEWIRQCLLEEGVTVERSRKVYAYTAQPRVYLKNGECMFAPGTSENSRDLFAIKLVQEDLDVIRDYDICHTSYFSNLEYELPQLQKLCKVSFDFSVKWDPEYLKRTCPYLTFAFFSGSDLTEDECEAFIKQVHMLGTKIVGVTRGAKGSIFYDGEQFYRQGIKQVNAVDTLGAGDSFIAGFLTAYGDGKTMEEALNGAAERAALTCTSYGAFGHPHRL